MEFKRSYTALKLVLVVLLMFLLKTTTTTLTRCIYPYASYFAMYMNVSLGRLFLVLSLGELLGALSPLFGGLSERMVRTLLSGDCFFKLLCVYRVL